MQGYPDLMQLRHLLWRNVPIECVSCSVVIKDRKNTQNVKEMLGIAKLFPVKTPDGALSSEADAVTWLLGNPALLDTLSRVVGFSKPVDSDGVLAYCTPAVEICVPVTNFAHGFLTGCLLQSKRNCHPCAPEQTACRPTVVAGLCCSTCYRYCLKLTVQNASTRNANVLPPSQLICPFLARKRTGLSTSK